MVFEIPEQNKIDFEPALEKVYGEDEVVEMFANILEITERARSERITYLKQLEIDIKPALEKVYGEDKVDEMFANILEIIERARSERLASLKMDDITRDCSWYKDEIMYTFYADQFGVKNKNTTNTFKDLIEMLPYLKDLGVTTLYILPFMDSPMGDAGFDVRDPQKVREDLGGIAEFDQFMAEAKKYGFKIQADLVLNHFSDQHEWFQDALNGDVSKLDYFVFRKEPPKYECSQDGTIIKYIEEDGGPPSERRLIFTDASEETHYRKVNIGRDDYYLYHTFYPFQLDINWENPEVLYYVLEKIIAFWSNKGIDIFRLDAIPFLIKEKGTNAENQPRTHCIIKILSSFNQAIGPRSIFHAEACEPPEEVLKYFSKERVFDIYGGENLTRTDGVQVAYNFPYMPAIWASLITGSNEYFWNVHEETPPIPESTAWAQFLRVHDELTVEMADTSTRKIIYDALLSKGKDFKGLGISGRMANFLDKNPAKIGLAFAILLSLPGMPVIYYGDEIGAENNTNHGEEAENKRKEVLNKIDTNFCSFDSRDINRGPILKSDFYSSEKDNVIYKTVKNLIEVRKGMPVLGRGKLSRLESDNKEIFSYRINSDDQYVIVVNNLSGEKLETSLTLSNDLVEKIGKTTGMVNLIDREKINVCLKCEKLIVSLEPYQTLWLN
ncbi:alpha-amylase family glycosyl hydrolase [Methanosarcina sp.]|uniref:alpha-amylase family glycosyl hydrolase n=1 Tax=Methanosarcina sp. TaxID=2213 RepID=UPI003C71254D